MIDNVRPNRVSKPIRAKTEKFELDVVRILNRYWLLICLCVFVGWMLSGTYAVLTEPIYESKASIMLIPKDANLAAKGVEGTRDTGGVINEDILATHVMLVQSPRLISTTLAKVISYKKVNGKIVFEGREKNTSDSQVVPSISVETNPIASNSPLAPGQSGTITLGTQQTSVPSAAADLSVNNQLSTQAATPPNSLIAGNSPVASAPIASNAQGVGTVSEINQSALIAPKQATPNATQIPQIDPTPSSTNTPVDSSIASVSGEPQMDNAESTTQNDPSSTASGTSELVQTEESEISRIKLEELPSLRNAMSPKDRSVASYVARNLTVTRGGEGQSRDAQAITIAFQHTNKEDAQLVVAAIIDSFQSFLDENFADKNNQAADLILKASRQLGEELSQTEKQYAIFRQNAPMLWSNEQSTNIYKMKYDQIQTELNELQLKKTEVASRLELVERTLLEIDARNGTDLERMALIDPTSAVRVGIFLEIFYNESQTAGFMAEQPTRVALATTEASNLLKLKSEYRAMVQELGELNPKVLALKESITEIENYLKEQGINVAFDPEKSIIEPRKLVDAYVRLLKNDLQEYAISETSLATASLIAETEAKKLISYEIEGEALQAKLEQQQELFKETVDRLRDINMTKDYAGFVNEILEDADVGEEVWPSMAICLVLGTLAGLGSAATGILFLELKNRTLRSSQDIETVTGVPILSYVPRMHKHEERKTLKEIQQRGSNVSPIVYTLHTPQSQESEIFRGMRTSIFFKSAEIKGKVFSITSSNSGDGKSTITANLVCSMAQAGRRVLLIECDLRRPAVAALLGCGGKLGLSDVLNDEISAEDAIQTCEASNLFVLSAGTIPENPAELLGSNEFKDLIDKLEQEYDFVLLDCPPVLAVSDPCIVSDVSDGVIVVVRVNPKSRVELQRTTSMLRDVQATIVGTIVNASQLEDDAAVGKDGYYVGYGYGTYGQRANGYYTERVASSGSSKRRKSSAKD
jgi:polysaccharide biosynthesis transport protein